MAAALLRPELPVIARTVSPAIDDRMQAFGTPTVVNPFDRFGDHLRLALRAPASYQLMTWLESGPGAPLPPRGPPPTHGRWVLCGYGRFGRSWPPTCAPRACTSRSSSRASRGRARPRRRSSATASSRPCWSGPGPGPRRRASSPAPTTTRRTCRWSPPPAGSTRTLFVAARQNRPASAPLFEAMHVDSLLVPAEVVAHEVYAQLSTPLLWRFLQEVPRARRRLGGRGGRAADRAVRPAPAGAVEGAADRPRRRPPCSGWLAAGGARSATCCATRTTGTSAWHAVAAAACSAATRRSLTPDDDVAARRRRRAAAGRAARRRGGRWTPRCSPTRSREYVLHGRHVPSSWIWRTLTRRPA